LIVDNDHVPDRTGMPIDMLMANLGKMDDFIALDDDIVVVESEV